MKLSTIVAVAAGAAALALAGCQRNAETAEVAPDVVTDTTEMAEAAPLDETASAEDAGSHAAATATGAAAGAVAASTSARASSSRSNAATRPSTASSRATPGPNSRPYSYASTQGASESGSSASGSMVAFNSPIPADAPSRNTREAATAPGDRQRGQVVPYAYSPTNPAFDNKNNR